MLFPLGYGGAYFEMLCIKSNSKILRCLGKTLMSVGFVVLALFVTLVVVRVFKLL